MQIRVTVTKAELDELKPLQRVYKNKDGTFRVYFNSLDDFLALIDKSADRC